MQSSGPLRRVKRLALSSVSARAALTARRPPPSPKRLQVLAVAELAPLVSLAARVPARQSSRATAIGHGDTARGAEGGVSTSTPSSAPSLRPGRRRTRRGLRRPPRRRGPPRAARGTRVHELAARGRQVELRVEGITRQGPRRCARGRRRSRGTRGIGARSSRAGDAARDSARRPGEYSRVSRFVPSAPRMTPAAQTHSSEGGSGRRGLGRPPHRPPGRLARHPRRALPLGLRGPLAAPRDGRRGLLRPRGRELFSRALGRHSPVRVVPATAAALSGAARRRVGARPRLSPRAAAVLVYLHVSTFGGALVSGFWSLVDERFDPTPRGGSWAHRHGRDRRRHGGGASPGRRPAPAVRRSPSCSSRSACSRPGSCDCGRTGPAPASPRTPAAAPLGRAVLLRNRPPARRRAGRAAGCAGRDDRWTSSSRRGRDRFEGVRRWLLFVFAIFHMGMGAVSLLLQATLPRPAMRSSASGLLGLLSLRPAAHGGRAPCSEYVRPPASPRRRSRVGRTSPSRTRSSARPTSCSTRPCPRPRSAASRPWSTCRSTRPGRSLGSAAVALVLALAPAARRDAALRARACLLSLAALGAVADGCTAATSRRSSRACSPGRVRLDAVEVIDHATQVTLAHTGHLERDTLLRQIAALARRGSRPSLAAHGGPAAPAGRSLHARPRSRQLRSGRARELVRAGAARAARSRSPPLVAGLLPLLGPGRRSCRTSSGRCGARRRASPASSWTPSLDPAVRPGREAARSRACSRPAPPPRAAEGLQAALDDPRFDDPRRRPPPRSPPSTSAAPSCASPREEVLGARPARARLRARRSTARSRRSSRCSRSRSSAGRCRSPGPR